MKYIWINPVTAGMYAADALDRFLNMHGYQRVEASAHLPALVKEKYKAVLKNADRTVIDIRCPKVLPLLEGTPLTRTAVIPDIEPILIHCGRELSKREELQGKEKLITTPCQALADLGNALHLPETHFLPWNTFLDSLGGGLTACPLQKSPIPLGFFAELDCRILSLTGEEEIQKYFARNVLPDTDLLEILVCKNGCHNGDGIRMCEPR